MDKEVLTLVLKEMQKAFGSGTEQPKEMLSDFIRIYLQENVYNNICLQDVCAHFNLSKSHICNVFQKETGSGIMEYYSEIKIQEAKRLIKRGDRNLSQIAEILKYASIHQFSRSFKNKVGVTPSVYRRISDK